MVGLRIEILGNGIPIYVQLREQLLAAIGRGELQPGARLPTMREIALDLRCDLNTVQRAWADLERAGILRTVRGRGTYLADAPRPGAGDLGAKADALAQKTIGEARALGVEPREVAHAILKRESSAEATHFQGDAQ